MSVCQMHRRSRWVSWPVSRKGLRSPPKNSRPMAVGRGVVLAGAMVLFAIGPGWGQSDSRGHESVSSRAIQPGYSKYSTKRIVAKPLKYAQPERDTAPDSARPNAKAAGRSHRVSNARRVVATEPDTARGIETRAYVSRSPVAYKPTRAEAHRALQQAARRAVHSQPPHAGSQRDHFRRDTEHAHASAPHHRVSERPRRHVYDRRRGYVPDARRVQRDHHRDSEIHRPRYGHHQRFDLHARHHRHGDDDRFFHEARRRPIVSGPRVVVKHRDTVYRPREGYVSSYRGRHHDYRYEYDRPAYRKHLHRSYHGHHAKGYVYYKRYRHCGRTHVKIERHKPAIRTGVTFHFDF